MDQEFSCGKFREAGPTYHVLPTEAPRFFCQKGLRIPRRKGTIYGKEAEAHFGGKVRRNLWIKDIFSAHTWGKPANTFYVANQLDSIL